MKKKSTKYPWLIKRKHNIDGYPLRDWFQGFLLYQAEGCANPKELQKWRDNLNEDVENFIKPHLFYDRGVFALIDHDKKNEAARKRYKKQGYDHLSERIRTIQQDKTRILVEIDLSKPKKQLLAEFAGHLDKHQLSISKKQEPLTKKELICDPWVVWSMKELDGLTLADITRILFDQKEITSDNACYAAVRRAHRRSLDIWVKLQEYIDKRIPAALK